MKGSIKFYNRKQQFGFIIGDDGKEYYFNQNAILPLREKELVLFEPSTSNKGEEARAVQRQHAESLLGKLPWLLIGLALGAALGHFL